MTQDFVGGRLRFGEESRVARRRRLLVLERGCFLGLSVAKNFDVVFAEQLVDLQNQILAGEPEVSVSVLECPDFEIVCLRFRLMWPACFTPANVHCADCLREISSRIRWPHFVASSG